MLADDASLAGSWPSVADPPEVDLLILHDLPYPIAGFVVATEADERHPPAKGGHVRGCVAGAAERRSRAVDPHDGNRRLRRDARAVTADVLIQHQVAQNEDMLGGKSLEKPSPPGTHRRPRHSALPFLRSSCLPMKT